MINFQANPYSSRLPEIPDHLRRAADAQSPEALRRREGQQNREGFQVQNSGVLNHRFETFEEILSESEGLQRPEQDLHREPLMREPSVRRNLMPEVDIKAEIAIDPERKRLHDVAHDFQQLFVEQMFSAMRKNLDPESDLLFAGQRQEMFEDLLFREYAQSMSRNAGFDLADQIYHQMSEVLPEIPEEALAAFEQARNRANSEASMQSDAMRSAGMTSGSGESLLTNPNFPEFDSGRFGTVGDQNGLFERMFPGTTVRDNRRGFDHPSPAVSSDQIFDPHEWRP